MIDANGPNIEERKRKYDKDERYVFCCRDVLEYNFTECYDLITLMHVIEHFEENKAIELLNRVKDKCNGLILVETPDQFENGLAVVATEQNPFQEHHFLASEAFMKDNGFNRLFTYRQNRLFTNSFYIWESL